MGLFDFGIWICRYEFLFNIERWFYSFFYRRGRRDFEMVSNVFKVSLWSVLELGYYVVFLVNWEDRERVLEREGGGILKVSGF